MMNRTIIRCILVLLLGLPPAAQADTYSFIVQPILPSAQTQLAYSPMADYLSKVTGHKIELKTSPNFLAYWQSMKSGEYDLVMDAAHLTDYRVKKLGYRILAKVLDVVSFSLVTGEDVLIFDASELVGKPIASLTSPSRGALIIENLFTHPIRRPILVEVSNAQDAIEKLLAGKVDGAVIPTPLLSNFPQLNVISTTEQWPHVALSASTKVPAAVAEKISKALISAADTTEGGAMLDSINFPGFEKTDHARYDGYADILKSVWGY